MISQRKFNQQKIKNIIDQLNKSLKLIDLTSLLNLAKDMEQQQLIQYKNFLIQKEKFEVLQQIFIILGATTQEEKKQKYFLFKNKNKILYIWKSSFTFFLQICDSQTSELFIFNTAKYKQYYHQCMGRANCYTNKKIFRFYQFFQIFCNAVNQFIFKSKVQRSFSQDSHLPLFYYLFKISIYKSHYNDDTKYLISMIMIQEKMIKIIKKAQHVKLIHQDQEISQYQKHSQARNLQFNVQKMSSNIERFKSSAKRPGSSFYQQKKPTKKININEQTIRQRQNKRNQISIKKINEKFDKDETRKIIKSQLKNSRILQFHQQPQFFVLNKQKQIQIKQNPKNIIARQSKFQPTQVSTKKIQVKSQDQPEYLKQLIVKMKKKLNQVKSKHAQNNKIIQNYEIQASKLSFQQKSLKEKSQSMDEQSRTILMKNKELKVFYNRQKAANKVNKQIQKQLSCLKLKFIQLQDQLMKKTMQQKDYIRKIKKVKLTKMKFDKQIKDIKIQLKIQDLEIMKKLFSSL